MPEWVRLELERRELEAIAQYERLAKGSETVRSLCSPAQYVRGLLRHAPAVDMDFSDDERMARPYPGGETVA